MRLFTGTSKSLIKDTTLIRIGELLSNAFFEQYRYKANRSEVASWQNSLRAMVQTIQYAELTDLGIALEYQLPKATPSMGGPTRSRSTNPRKSSTRKASGSTRKFPCCRSTPTIRRSN